LQSLLAQGWIDTFKLFKNDARVEAMIPVEVLRASLTTLKTETSGIGEGISYVLTNPVHRETFVKITKSLSSKNDISKIFEIVIAQVKNGNFNEALHFLFDHFAVGP
jgi:hypothetical protein